MAVSTFITGWITNMALLKTFLNSNKSGTFLEDATISLPDTTGNVKLAIKKDDMTATITNVPFEQATGQNGDYTVVELKEDSAVIGQYIYHGLYMNSDRNREIRFGGAKLCTNGLILRFSLMAYSTSSGVYGYTEMYALITTDSNNKLAVIFDRDDYTEINGTSFTSPVNKGFRAITCDVTRTDAVTLTSFYGSSKTVLVPIVPTDADSELSLPHVFAATQTQAVTTALETVVIGADTYITNGYWYVKDGDN